MRYADLRRDLFPLSLFDRDLFGRVLNIIGVHFI